MIPFARIGIYGNKVTSTIKKIQTGFQTLYVLYSNGELWGCGTNSYGQLGLGNTTSVTQLTLLTSGVLDIWNTNDADVLLRKADGMYVAGLGQLMGTANTSRTVFTNVNSSFSLMGNYDNIKKVHCNNTVYFLMNDGSTYGCGVNSGGQLGRGSTTRISTVVNLSAAGTVLDIGDNGRFGTCHRVQSTGVLQGAGSNNGRFGTASATDSTTWTTQSGAIPMSNFGTTSLMGVSGAGIFVQQGSTLYVSGNQDSGGLGTGVSTGYIYGLNTHTVSFDCTGLSAIYTSNATAASALLKFNTGAKAGLWVSGANANGQLGMGDTTNRLVFTRIPIDSIVQDYSKLTLISTSTTNTHFVYDNKLYACGLSTSNTMPGYSTQQNSFVQISTPY